MSNRKQTPMSEQQSWFYTRQVLPGVWMIDEPQHVYSWLVEGRDRAVLLDTGLGVEPIRPVAERLTAKPISVVNTHYHFDHVGGNHQFEEIAIHAVGAPLLGAETPPELLRAYMRYAQRQLDAAEVVQPLDREFFWLLTAETRPRPFPAGFDPDAWRIVPSRPATVLEEGDTIELGDRTLTVIHTPGHSPDSISLLEEREGLLFAADAFNIGPVYCHFPDSDLDALASTAARLADLADHVDRIVVHHYGRVIAETNLLKRYAEDVARLQAGDVDLDIGRDILEGTLLEARFEQYSVTLPDPEAPQSVLGAERREELPSPRHHRSAPPTEPESTVPIAPLTPLLGVRLDGP